MYFFTTDDNEEPDSQYEAYLAAFTEEDEYESKEKSKYKQRGRYARSTRRRQSEEDSYEEIGYNPAEPQSRSPDSHSRRQEYLAKVAAAAGSMYACYTEQSTLQYV
jgi:hypothetical protein